MKVTLITSVYNGVATIRDAMESVWRQKGVDLEYIVMDGGSTDGTIEVIREFEGKFSSFSTFKWVSAKDRGLYDAINRGIGMATGDVIGICNADDVLAADDVLSRVVAGFDDDVDATYADIRFVKGGTGVDELRQVPCSRYCTGKFFRTWMFRFATFPAHPSTFVRRSCFERYGLYSLDYSICADFEMMLRLFVKQGIRTRYLPICTHVMRAGGMSTNGFQSNCAINSQDLRALRAHGIWSCLPLIYTKYLFKIWGFVFRRRRVAGVLVLALLSMGAVRLPKHTTSSDGFVRVFEYENPADPIPFRGPILTFVTRVTQTLDSAYGAGGRFKEPALVIYAGEERTNDARVVARPQKGKVLTKIFLPAPGYSDLEQLRFEVARAYFRARTGAEDLWPKWLVRGALRAADGATRANDVRQVLTWWAAGRLPSFPNVCVAVETNAVFAGYVAGWLKEEKKLLREGQESAVLLAKELAHSEMLAEKLTGEKEAMAQDRAADERLLRLAHRVLSPGKTSAWDCTYFASRLDVYPQTFDTGAYAFEQLTGTCRTNEQVRAAVCEKARMMMFWGLGRGEALTEAAQAYGEFLTQVARADDVADESENQGLARLLAVAGQKWKKAYEENGKDSHGRR